ncbi:NACHT domain-containing protein [Streptomyces sp. NPDC051001]|uniref:NACHT domain-containing protein n=1 Tax=Streptomyces sp. NPDC051001 TaxID=3155795 RepID=UPI00341341DA
MASVGWTLWVLRTVRLNEADTAGVLGLTLSVVGVVLTAWGVRLTIRGLHTQLTGSAIAASLARSVLKAEGRHYRQLLGGDLQALNGPIDLHFVLCGSTGVTGAAPEGSLKGIAAYYRAVRPGRLIITGTSDAALASTRDAGTGKTVLAVALALGLAQDRGAQEPVPVRLSAATWPGDTVRDWLVEHLIRAFGHSRAEAHNVVDDHLVLPVIDGLDEMDATIEPGYASRAARLLRAVEEYERAGTKAPVVLICRREQYEALTDAEAQPQVVAHIGITPIDPARIHTYLRKRVGYSPRNLSRWQPVLDAIGTASDGLTGSLALRDALNTPWRLTLAAVVFEERDPESGRFLRDPLELLGLADSGQLYEYLLHRYIKAAVNAPSRSTHVTNVETDRSWRRMDWFLAWRRLAVLAGFLNANSAEPRLHTANSEPSGTDLVLHKLWAVVGMRRAQIVVAALAWAPTLVWLTVSLDYSIASFDLLLVLTSVVISVLLASSVETEPEPRMIPWGLLFTRSGLFRLAASLTVGALTGASIGFVLRLLFGSEPATTDATAGPTGSAASLPAAPASGTSTHSPPQDEIPVWLPPGPKSPTFGDGSSGYSSINLFSNEFLLWLGLVIGLLSAIITLVATLAALRDDPLLTTDPRAPIRQSIAVSFSVAVATCTIAVWVTNSLNLSYSYFILGPSMAVPAILHSVSGRYLAFLLCMRGKLPWRLGRFLHECHNLGILRSAGIAYQFRHRELQDHLARHPLPPPEV